MKITLIAVGCKMPKWVEEGFKEYQKRLPSDNALILKEIPLQKRVGDFVETKARQKESKEILEAIPKNSYIIALDERGKEYTSEDLAQKFSKLKLEYSSIALLVGGPEGHSDEVRAKAHELWSLGKLTLPHPLVRIVLAETLYRAWSMEQGLPYHRA